LAITISLVAPAEATTTYYIGSSGETSFTTAVGGLTLLDPALIFSGTPDSTGLPNASGTGIAFLGFDDFADLNPFTFTLPSGSLTATIFGEVVQIAFPATGVYALGIRLSTVSGSGTWCVDVTTGGCANNIFNSSPSDQEFFGVVSNASITAPLYIHFTTGNPKIVLTNFEAFGAAVDPVPEPRTMLLVGLGLVILPLVPRKIHRKTPPVA
jgi:hypothetical protein